MLKRLVVKARNQPRQTRDRYAFSVAVGFTAVIAMVWLYHAPSRIIGSMDGAAEGVKPFTSFLDQIGDQVATVKESLPDTNNVDGVFSATTSSEDRTWSTPEEYRGWSLRNVPTTTSETAASTSASSTPGVVDTTQTIRIVTTSSTPTTTEQTP
tara:strand:- start:2640 stop:3101 length:462 start_codon:yes stop_codon:yes gene_type:complete